MTRVALTRKLAFASGQDAGNQNMRASGRTAWNEDDADIAAGKTTRLLLHVPGDQGGLQGLLLTPKDRRDLGLEP